MDRCTDCHNITDNVENSIKNHNLQPVIQQNLMHLQRINEGWPIPRILDQPRMMRKY